MRRLAPLLILPGLLLLAIEPAAAAPPPTSLAAARARQAQLAQVRAELGDTIAANLAAQDQLAQALEDNRRESDALAQQLADADAKLVQMDGDLAQIDRQTAALRARIGEERQQLDRLARALYVRPDSLLVSLAEAGSVRDMITELGDLESASERARALRRQLARDEAALAETRRKEASEREQAASSRAALQTKADRLRELARQQQSSLATLQDRLAGSQAELASVNVQSTATATYITSALQAEQAEATAAAYASVWAQVQLLSSGKPPSGDAAFANPLPGATVTQPFGPTDLWFEPPYAGFAHFHTGIDLAAPAGTPVLAAADGVVVLAGFNQGGYGNYVVIAHADGLDTLYGHLDSIAVQQGQTVRRGQPVGAEGSTGNSTGPHLHFEVRRAGQPADPAGYMPA